MAEHVLVRYGTVAEVARFRVGATETLDRGQRVVIRTRRGLEIGTLLEPVPAMSGAVNGDEHGDPTVLRAADADDEARRREHELECETEFAAWTDRIQRWNLDLELIDLEWTLDRTKLVLYVLNNRGFDCTRLALQAAAAGLGVVEVQPVGSEGPVSSDAVGGCGTGGCGCH